MLVRDEMDSIHVFEKEGPVATEMAGLSHPNKRSFTHNIVFSVFCFFMVVFYFECHCVTVLISFSPDLF